jgi:methylated-DNA-protein-cysteine methyltransferase-like protein
MALKNTKNDFYESVYQVVMLVPKGRVTTYGAIAKVIGTGLTSRMVGWAMNASHNQNAYVPAHRVVNRNGLLTGKHHFPIDNPMDKQLHEEGIIIVEDKVQDFKTLFWNPMNIMDTF